MSVITKGKIRLEELKKDVESLKKKIFVYETLQAEKEIREGKTKGAFKSGKEVLKSLKI